MGSVWHLLWVSALLPVSHCLHCVFLGPGSGFLTFAPGILSRFLTSRFWISSGFLSAWVSPLPFSFTVLIDSLWVSLSGISFSLLCSLLPFSAFYRFYFLPFSFSFYSGSMGLLVLFFLPFCLPGFPAWVLRSPANLGLPAATAAVCLPACRRRVLYLLPGCLDWHCTAPP